MTETPMSVLDGLSLAGIFLCIALLCHLIQKWLEQRGRRPASSPNIRLVKNENGFVGEDQNSTVRERMRQDVLVRTQKQNAEKVHRHFFLGHRGDLIPAVVKENGAGYDVQLRDYFGRGIGPTFQRPASQIFLK